MQLIPHLTRRNPCPPDTLVAYRLADDPTIRTDRADSLAWDLMGEPGRIEAYKPLEFTAPTTPYKRVFERPA